MTDEIRNKDDAKGRVKEAAGNLTGDDDLKREGKVDKATGAAKDGVEKVADKVKDVLGTRLTTREWIRGASVPRSLGPLVGPLSPDELAIDDLVEGVSDAVGGSTGDPGSSGDTADVFGGSQRVPVGIKRFSGGGHGAAVVSEQAPAPLADQVFICVELGHFLS